MMCTADHARMVANSVPLPTSSLPVQALQSLYGKTVYPRKLCTLGLKLLTSKLERPVTNTTMINYSTRDFATKEQLELYLLRQEKAFSPEVIKLFTEAGMLRRAVTQIWNKEQSYRVGIVFEYRDQEAYKACQALLEEHYLPAVEGLTTKVVGSRGVLVHEFVSADFQD